MADAVASVEALGDGRCIGITADCTVESEVERAFAETAAAFGSVDIAVACVGGGGTVQGKAVSTAGKSYTVAEHSTEDYMGILALTQFATFYTCREGARRMKEQGGGGRIIIIGSVMSNFAATGSAAYSGAKASIKQMGKVMANELGGFGITVNTIQPGWMATLGEKRQTGHGDEYSTEESDPIPAKRMGTPQDIGASAAFLCSDEAFYINGTSLLVDGGFSAALSLPSSSSPAKL